MDTTDHFGTWLRRQRKAVLGLTQAELADLVFCSKGMITKIERGERRPAKELAGRLIAELGVPPAEQVRYVAWARGLPLPVSPAVPGVAGDTAGDVVRLNQPVSGHQDWVLMPLDAVITTGFSPACVGVDCNGKDPEVTGCATISLTVEEVTITGPGENEPIALVELRFSRACQTNWARVTKYRDGPNAFRAYLRDERGEIIAETIAVAAPGSSYVYGPMWYAPTGKIAVQACGEVDGYAEICTNLH